MMKPITPYLALFAFVLSSPLSGQTPVINQKPNVLLICVDDLRPELNAYGQSYMHSPNIDELAEEGRLFKRHFVNAPSCGPSRYTLLTGRYGPYGNNAIFRLAEQREQNPGAAIPSMPEWFRQHGYTTVSVGKISHHPGGRGGPNWDDSESIEMPEAWTRHLMPSGAWLHPRGAMHGLAHGEIRENAGDMAVFQAAEGNDEIYPDGLIKNVAINELSTLSESEETPFFLAVGFIRPHLPFGAPKRYLDLYDGVELPEVLHPDKPTWTSTWHNSREFMKYKRWNKNPITDASFADEVRRHYAASVSYIDAQVGELLAHLEATGSAENTIVVLWGDHGWHLGERAIWGKHSLFEESLHAPLIIKTPSINTPGISTDAIVETVDIFPTLCELTTLPTPEAIHGRSLQSQLSAPGAKGHTAIAYTNKAQTIRDDHYRLIRHNSGELELYTFECNNQQHIRKFEENLAIQPLIDALDAKLALRN